MSRTDAQNRLDFHFNECDDGDSDVDDVVVMMVIVVLVMMVISGDDDDVDA
jgi:hypothetical protein